MGQCNRRRARAHLPAAEVVEQQALDLLHRRVALKHVAHKHKAGLQGRGDGKGCRAGSEAVGTCRHWRRHQCRVPTLPASVPARPASTRPARRPQQALALLPSCVTAAAPPNDCTERCAATPNSTRSYSRPSYSRPSTRLCGRFFWCLCQRGEGGRRGRGVGPAARRGPLARPACAGAAAPPRAPSAVAAPTSAAAPCCRALSGRGGGRTCRAQTASSRGGRSASPEGPRRRPQTAACPGCSG